jgi:hypothetical protein
MNKSFRLRRGYGGQADGQALIKQGLSISIIFATLLRSSSYEGQAKEHKDLRETEIRHRPDRF